MLNSQIRACLRLFNCYVKSEDDNNCWDCDDTVEKYLIKNGLFFYTLKNSSIPNNVIEEAVDLYGIKPEKWNNTFHESFDVVKNLDNVILAIQQYLHYYTVHLSEIMNNSFLMYIPKKDLNIPQIKEDTDVVLKVIVEIREEELQDKLLTLITTNIALSEETIQDIKTLIDYIPANKSIENIKNIKNKEIKSLLYKKYDIIPENNIEFLRYLVYKVTGKTLLIKNKETIEAIKSTYYPTEVICYTLVKYIDSYGYIPLAEIFQRYKPIFLAFKQSKQLNKIINKISKLSKKYHKPYISPIIDRLTRIKTKKELEELDINSALNNISIYKELTLINALRYRTKPYKNYLYRIRNGKVYVKEKHNINKEYTETMKELYYIVYRHLLCRLKTRLENKTVYIPEDIKYALPTSQKQFVNNVPQGSYIELKRADNLIVGVHWKNCPKGRVDLDLHIINPDMHIGWNGQYKDEDKDFYFSGDITNPDEKLGATEVFFISSQYGPNNFILTLNNYISPDCDIEYEFFIAYHNEEELNKEYTVDPNNVLFSYKDKFEYDSSIERFVTTEKTIGFIEILDDKIKFSFENLSTGLARATTHTEVSNQVYESLLNQLQIKLLLEDLITKDITTICNSPVNTIYKETIVEGETLYKKLNIPVDYDLTFNTLDKNTFIKLLEGN